MVRLVDLLGQSFGRLTVTNRAESTSKGLAQWKCKCECGNETVVRGSHLRNGNTRSCGCLRDDKLRNVATKHGLSKTKEYNRFKCKTRKERKSKHTPKWADINEIRNIYMNCPEGYHVDHIIPLRGDTVCGLHVESNLQYLPAIENLRKGNRWKEEDCPTLM
jgi:hypothetical protein